MQNGALYQWDDATGFKYIDSGVNQVSAGWNGNSAVLYSTGRFALYNTDSNAWTSFLIADRLASVSLGTDVNGQTMLDAVTTYGGHGLEWRPVGGWEALAAGSVVQQISAGVGGHSAILLNDGTVWDYRDATSGSASTSTFIASAVASVSCGSDCQLGTMIDVVYTNGSAWEHNGTTGSWKYLGAGVVEADAGGWGATDLCNSNGSIVRYNDNTGLGLVDTFTTIYSTTNRNFLG
jgi:hypothetical protein